MTFDIGKAVAVCAQGAGGKKGSSAVRLLPSEQLLDGNGFSIPGL